MLGVPQSEFAQKCLDSHNKYRALHGSSSLTLNETLSEYAQEWANDLASREVIEHRESNRYGENLYTNYSDDKEWKVDPSDPVESWYREIERYTFGEESPKNFQDVGHFTQVVWKETKEMGVGVTFGKNGHVYVVCNYDPPGNVKGIYDKNVLRGDTSEVDREGPGKKFPSKIILTESDEKLGIRLVQPNPQLYVSMETLAAVPSVKLRVWTVWLEKIIDQSILWSRWLRGHIDLVMRMRLYLDRLEAGESKDAETEKEQVQSLSEIKRDAGDAEYLGNFVRTKSREGRRDARESVGSREKTENLKDTEEPEITKNHTYTGSGSDIERGDDDYSKDKKIIESDDGMELDVSGGETRKESKERTDRDTENENSLEKINNKSWPIGVAWKPRKSQKRREEGGEDEEKLLFDKISIPKTEEQMELLIKSVRRNATIYRSLRKHWLETGNQAVREMLGRSVTPALRLPFSSYEDVPYDFYLKADLDIEIGLDHEDEEVLLPDETRERVTRKYEHLYFNLLDKPGKGGKPWF